MRVGLLVAVLAVAGCGGERRQDETRDDYGDDVALEEAADVREELSECGGGLENEDEILHAERTPAWECEVKREPCVYCLRDAPEGQVNGSVEFYPYGSEDIERCPVASCSDLVATGECDLYFDRETDERLPCP